MNKQDKKTDYLIEISTRFNKNLRIFITIAEKKAPKNDHIKKLKNIIYLAKSIDELAVIRECWQNIWNNKEHIHERNLKIFDNYYKLIQHTQKEDYKGKYSDLIFELAKFISTNIKILTDQEKNYLWSIADELVVNVAEYRALVDQGVDFYEKFKEKLNIKNF